MFEIEHAFACPYCAALVTMLLDPSIASQRYVEDCEVCFNPIEIAYRVEGEALVAFEARSIEQ